MQKNMILVVGILFSTTLYAETNSSAAYEDIYHLSFSKENNCTLLKNSKNTPLFDKRFEKKKPRSSYTCDAIQKEQYNECVVLEKKNITALFFGYGSYEMTNLIIAFKNPHESVESSVKVACTKKIIKK